MHPTVKSIDKILSLYSSTTKVLNKNVNIDTEDQLYNISSNRKCLLGCYKSKTKVLEDFLGTHRIPNIRQRELDDERDFHNVLICMIWVALARRPPS